MRQSTLNAIVATFVISIILLFMVKQTEWPEYEFEKSNTPHKKSSVDAIFSPKSRRVSQIKTSKDNPSFRNLPGSLSPPDVTRMIASQPYYKTLCEKDREDLHMILATLPN